MRIDAVKIGIDPPREVNVIIEVPVGGEPIKYEMDKEAGTLIVDRFLYTAMRGGKLSQAAAHCPFSVQVSQKTDAQSPQLNR